MAEDVTTSDDPVLRWLVDKKVGKPEHSVCWLTPRLVFEVLGVTTDSNGYPAFRNGERLSEEDAKALRRLSTRVGYLPARRLFCLRPGDRDLAPLLKEVAVAIGRAAGIPQHNPAHRHKSTRRKHLSAEGSGGTRG